MPGILTHEQKQLAFRLRARGWQLVDVAREIGCTAPMVGLMVREGCYTARGARRVGAARRVSRDR